MVNFKQERDEFGNVILSPGVACIRCISPLSDVLPIKCDRKCGVVIRERLARDVLLEIHNDYRENENMKVC